MIITVARLDYCDDLVNSSEQCCANLCVLQPAQTLTFHFFMGYLHWVPVEPHVKFKTLFLAYNGKNEPPGHETLSKTKHRLDVLDDPLGYVFSLSRHSNHVMNLPQVQEMDSS